MLINTRYSVVTGVVTGNISHAHKVINTIKCGYISHKVVKTSCRVYCDCKVVK